MKSKSGRFFIPVLAFIGIILGAFYGTGVAEKGGDSAPTKAIAVLRPTEGNKVYGTVTFTQAEKGIRVVADIKELSPGKHAFHIHEYGDCSATDAASAGAHFNPGNMPHGAPSAKQRHVGDLENLEASNAGTAKLEMVDPMLSMSGEHSIIGRSVIVHAQPDDFTTQPAGGAGGRVACGVIGIAKK